MIYVHLKSNLITPYNKLLKHDHDDIIFRILGIYTYGIMYFTNYSEW